MRNENHIGILSVLQLVVRIVCQVWIWRAAGISASPQVACRAVRPDLGWLFGGGNVSTKAINRTIRSSRQVGNEGESYDLKALHRSNQKK